MSGILNVTAAVASKAVAPKPPINPKDAIPNSCTSLSLRVTSIPSCCTYSQ
ncbi:MAG: hypothetical protein KME29_31290 [Calothrix sp. FI2-JRJ7]|nr:hypothetical protein [Calothrix sp. FI2-JRJ7]